MDKNGQKQTAMEKNGQKQTETFRNGQEQKKKQTELDKTEQNTEQKKTFEIFAFDGTTHNA